MHFAIIIKEQSQISKGIVTMHYKKNQKEKVIIEISGWLFTFILFCIFANVIL